MDQKEEKLGRRFVVFSLLVSFIFIVIVIRLSYLQILKAKEFKQSAEQNRYRILTINAPRGRFFDRTGEELVTSRPAFVVSYMVGNESKAEQSRMLEKLRVILGMTKTDMDDVLKKYAKEGRPYEPIVIKTDVDMDTVTRIEERKAELPGVMVDTQSIRYYKYGTLAAHLFGYVGQINKEELDKLKSKGYKIGDIIGKIGLEKLYDSQIRGEDGGRMIEVDAQGHPAHPNQPLGMKKPVPGNDLLLTIDLQMQQAAETSLQQNITEIQKSFPNAKAGAVVAMDVKTGAILAMASYPNFDPNIFARGITSAEWKALSTNPTKVFNDRVISATYPPGSVFKIITGISALETGKATVDSNFFCPGYYYLGGHRFRCWKHSGHGNINIEQGYQYSCDVVFYTLGRAVGPETMSYYAHQFGLGELTGFELPGESKGRVPDPEWKKQYFKNNPALQPWYPGETVITAIGQGDNLYTPLQLVTMMSAVANGGKLYVPYVVDKVMKPDGTVIESHHPVLKRKVNVSPKSLEIVRRGLRMVTEPGGTAYSIFQDFPIPVAGKTGTAQNAHGDDHAWFAAYAPADDPEVAVVCIIEQGGHGGLVAGPVVKSVFQAAFQDTIKARQVEGSLMNQSIGMQ